MSKLVLTILTLAFIAAPLPALAQKAQKAQRSCDDVCYDRCQVQQGTWRSYCTTNCTQRCMLLRQKKNSPSAPIGRTP